MAADRYGRDDWDDSGDDTYPTRRRSRPAYGQSPYPPPQWEGEEYRGGPSAGGQYWAGYDESTYGRENGSSSHNGGNGHASSGRGTTYGSYRGGGSGGSAGTYGGQAHGQRRPPYGEARREGRTYGGQSTYGRPSYADSSYAQPSYAEPRYGEPSYGEPAYGEPAYGEPPYDEPPYDEPHYDGPYYRRGGPQRPPFGDPRDRPYGTAPLPPPRAQRQPVRSRGDDELSWRSRVRERRKNMPLWQELPLLLIVAFCLAVLIRTFLLQAFFIPSGSMEDTLLVGDRVLVNKIVYDVREPQRGEVIVFKGTDNWAPENQSDPNAGFMSRLGRTIGDLVGMSQPGEKDFIKRVIGLPGDVVACCDSEGRVTVNGYGLDESPYLIRNSPIDVAPSNRECRSRRFNPVTVEPGNMFVMGDHRAVSQDSRCQGQVPIANVIGRAFVIVWPSARWAGLPVPPTFANVPKPFVAAPIPGPKSGSRLEPETGAAKTGKTVAAGAPPRPMLEGSAGNATIQGLMPFLVPFVVSPAVPARSRRGPRSEDVNSQSD